MSNIYCIGMCETCKTHVYIVENAKILHSENDITICDKGDLILGRVINHKFETMRC